MPEALLAGEVQRYKNTSEPLDDMVSRRRLDVSNGNAVVKGNERRLKRFGLAPHRRQIETVSGLGLVAIDGGQESIGGLAPQSKDNIMALASRRTAKR
ncbi:hypothetical protein K7H91_08870 [Martelella mediterranea]|uniref:hypothetical protein n=1 Tax=Martelella mediterranea TaxID=293089 RepID=UPI001E566942|nr:hypothetical protein [Martelella mediterranea]MCD1633882.1 hypothetical protein [Martelella mediterranea]